MPRTTILLGAGTAVELKTNSMVPSTWNITYESLLDRISKIDDGGIKLLNDIYATLYTNSKFFPTSVGLQDIGLERNPYCIGLLA